MSLPLLAATAAAEQVERGAGKEHPDKAREHEQHREVHGPGGRDEGRERLGRGAGGPAATEHNAKTEKKKANCENENKKKEGTQSLLRVYPGAPSPFRQFFFADPPGITLSGSALRSFAR